MLVKFVTSLAGKQVIKPGEVVEMPGDEAMRHLKSGNAVKPDAVEVAVHRAREKALSEQRALAEKETVLKGAETR